MNSFWNKLPKPFFALAPMANVTDAAFRRLIADCAKPDVMWTEFVSADGLFHTREIKKIKNEENPLMNDLIFSESERPIVAQFFTARPEMMEKAAELALELAFDGIDINMGCPDKAIEKQGAGAVLCENPSLARDLIKSAKRGAQNKLPVSVKIRLGYNGDILDKWLSELLTEKPSAVTIHARTMREMSKVPAHWDRIKVAVQIRNSLNSRSLIIGNGDVLSLLDGRERAAQTGCDGIMLGKAIFGNPFLFSSKINIDMNIRKRLTLMIEHTRLFHELLGHKNFSIMKKHYKAYISGWNGAKELRLKLMGAKDFNEVKSIALKYLENYQSEKLNLCV